MADFTTEQVLPVSFKVVDGRGRPAPIEGDPVVASSDETVVRVSDAGVANEGGNYSFTLESVAAGTARVSVTADADLGEGVNEIIGTLDVNVTLDPRSEARTIELTAGTPTDEP